MAKTTGNFNLKDLSQELDFYGYKTFWFHAFNPTINGEHQKGDMHNEFTNTEGVIKLCKKYNGQGILCVAVNERLKDKTQAKDVKNLNILLYDIDVKKNRKKQYVSTPEDHEHAIKTAQEKIKPYLERLGFSVDLIKDSGNGCQISSKVRIQIPKIDDVEKLTIRDYKKYLQEKYAKEEDRKKYDNNYFFDKWLNEKWQEKFKQTEMYNRLTILENGLKNFNDEIIEVDCITKDINRRTKLAGTINKKDTNQKEDRLAKIIYVNPAIDVEKNNYAFNSIHIEVKEEQKQEETKTKTIDNKDITEIINGNEKIKRLFEGDKSGYKSRSEAELGLIVMLMNRGITTFKQIDTVMQASKIGKWQEAGHSYQNSVYNKGLIAHRQHEAKKTTREDNTQEEEFLKITKFNEPTQVYLNSKSEIYNHTIRTKKNNSVYFKHEYTIYEGNIGQGNDSIFIKTKYKLDLGDRKLYLKQIDYEQLKEMLYYMDNDFLIHNLCKKIHIKITKGKGDDQTYRSKDEIISDILELDFTFFEPVLPIDKSDLRNITQPLQTIYDILKNGLFKEDTIDYIYSADIPEVNTFLIEPKEYMRFAPHKIIITGEKSGKSTNAFFIAGEPPLERASEAGLLGFADSQKRSYGKLHLRTKPSYIDEVQEEKGEELFGKLHTYMEIGETEISRGIGITIRGYSGITFQGNPKAKEEVNQNLLDYLMMKQFRDFLNTISKNIKPFSSRIGLTYFKSDTKRVRGNPNDNKQTEKGQKIIRTIAEGHKDEFTNLFKDSKVRKWLNTEFDKEYTDNVENIGNKCDDSVIKDYLLGQIEAYKHTRGIALRMAFLEIGLTDVWKTGLIDVDKILETADYHLQKIKKINIDSYLTITSLSISCEKQIWEMYIKNIKPEYVKLSIYTLFEWVLAQEKITNIVILSEIEPFYEIVRELLNIGLNHKYRSFSRIKEYYENFNTNIKDVLSDYHIQYDNVKKSFILLDLDKIKKYSKIYKGIKDTIGTKENKDNEQDKDTKDTKDMDNTKDTESNKESEIKEAKNSKTVSFVTVCPCPNKAESTLKKIVEPDIKLNSKSELLAHMRKDPKKEYHEDDLKQLVNNEDDLYKWLEELSKKGEIYSVRPFVWRVLQ